ncbi:hypothetical protein Bcoa_1977 [Heyndrickxia coagulans 36D1]|uniref:Uncharacterized protein n=1 Tax=Heyndrickxia coagulans 36D1 TaxID=345219 RepID=G2TMU0_HEYCO|nr:hypothetical protein Bcoa_1977 [Heyndrickxia coagulans 36D1]
MPRDLNAEIPGLRSRPVFQVDLIAAVLCKGGCEERQKKAKPEAGSCQECRGTAAAVFLKRKIKTDKTSNSMQISRKNTGPFVYLMITPQK